MSHTRLKKSSSAILLLFLALLSISIISKVLNFRIDVTEDSIYSLSDGSFNIAKTFAEDVNVKMYFSRSSKNIPVVFKAYATRVEEVLKEFASHSDGVITLELIDPRPDTDDESWALKYGLQSIPLQNQQFFLGAVFLSGEKEIAIPYLDPRKEEFLEYDIAEALVKLKTETKPKLGIYSHFPVFGNLQSGLSSPYDPNGEEWAFVASLKNLFDVTKIEKAEDISNDFNVIILLHPKDIKEDMSFAIDQYLIQGGHLIAAVDPLSRQDLMSSDTSGMTGGQIPKVSSKLETLFKHWGLIYDDTKMVGDPMRSTSISLGGRQVDYPYILSLTEEDFSKKNKMTAHLKQMLLGEAGSLALEPSSTLTFEPLIQTSDRSGQHHAMMAIYQGPESTSAQFKVEPIKRTTAAMLSGKFTSAYPAAPEGQKQHFKGGDKESHVLVVADSDFLVDNNAVTKMRFGPQVILRPRNDNLNFIINAAEFLGGNQDLISIRSSGRVSRPFTTVMEIQQEAQKKWKEEEDKLSRQLNELQGKLRRLQEQRSDGNLTSLQAQQEAEIRKFREEEIAIKKARRQVRKNLREDIEALGHKIIAANLLVVPLLVSIFGVLIFVRREKKARGM